MFTLILTGFLVGLTFGFLLQKGNVANFNTIVGQFLFKNLTVLNIMLTAIIVGGVLIFSLSYFNIVHLIDYGVFSFKKEAIGGVVFGLGMATLGYCPGTALAAVGQGAKDAIFGILGMVFGAFVFSHFHNFFKNHLLSNVNPNIGIQDLTGISPFLIFTILILVAFGVNYFFKKIKS